MVQQNVETVEIMDDEEVQELRASMSLARLWRSQAR
jgi:hypothetical protein